MAYYFNFRPIKNKTTNLEIIRALEQEKIESRPVWKPMHLQELYKAAITLVQEDVSSRLFNTGICLPSGSNLRLNCRKNN